MSQLMYASPAWWGYTNAKDRKRLDQIISKLKRMGLLDSISPSADSLAEEADSRLFSAIRFNPEHILHRLLPTHRSQTRYVLRPRTHDFKLPFKDDRNFVSRVLYKNIY